MSTFARTQLSRAVFLSRGRARRNESTAWPQVVHNVGIRSCRLRHRRRSFTTGSSPDDKKDAAAAAATLKWMSEQVASEGEAVVEKWISRLSPTVQRELSRLSRETSKTTTTTTSASAATAAAAATTTIAEPPMSELRKVALNQAIPFVGFGIMDNSILIIAGDAIDTSLGVALGISTMCAAALGNIISDVAGIALGTAIEDFCARLGLPTPNVTQQQRALRSVRFAGQFGCALGIVVGCFIGMFPLLLLDPNKAQRLKQETHMDQVFQDFVREAKGLVGAQICNLYVVVDSPQSTTMASAARTGEEENLYFYGKYNDGAEHIHVPIGKGIVSRAALKGVPMNIPDVHAHPDFDKKLWDPIIPSTQIHSMLCVPVFDSQGKVVAVIQAINKISRGLARRNTNKTMSAFTATDVQILKVLASHVGVTLQLVHQEEAEVSLQDTIRILKEQGLMGIHESTSPLDEGPLACGG